MALRLISLALAVGRARAGFDWGAGCEGGSGSFTTTLAEGATVDVGSIPKGKWTVTARITASADVDVQLFDADDTSTYAEGAAIVAWVEDPATANGGVLGAEEGAASATYEGMAVTYSGFGGVDGQPGKEFIRIDGEATRTLALKAFAFEAGDGARRNRVQLHFNMSWTTVSGSEKLSETPVCRTWVCKKVLADLRRMVSR